MTLHQNAREWPSQCAMSCVEAALEYPRAPENGKENHVSDMYIFTEQSASIKRTCTVKMWQGAVDVII
jgi:hypothetical protein